MSKLARHRDLPAQASQKVERTLVVGNLARWNAQGRATSAFGSFHYTEFADLDGKVLRDVDPNIILSPLMDNKFDVIEVVERLRDLGYGGRYRAITEMMPNAEMVRAEIRSYAPNLDFDLLVMPEIANDG